MFTLIRVYSLKLSHFADGRLFSYGPRPCLTIKENADENVEYVLSLVRGTCTVLPSTLHRTSIHT